MQPIGSTPDALVVTHLHDRVAAVRDRRVEAEWRVAARGRVTEVPAISRPGPGTSRRVMPLPDPGAAGGPAVEGRRP